MLMDRFNDYEENRVLAPSRDEGLQLLIVLQNFLELEEDFKLLIS
jgi:hypothetical protein